jgi:hypothetical protein
MKDMLDLQDCQGKPRADSVIIVQAGRKEGGIEHIKWLL